MVYQGSFQDVFLVLAGLVWIGYSAFRSGKKKQKSSTAVSHGKTSKKNSLFEELLAQYTQGTKIEPEENFNVKNDFNIATENKKNESSIETVRRFTDSDIYEEEESEESLEARSALDETEIVVKTNKQKREISNRNFNLKKAFIYSEILNQKYI